MRPWHAGPCEAQIQVERVTLAQQQAWSEIEQGEQAGIGTADLGREQRQACQRPQVGVGGEVRNGERRPEDDIAEAQGSARCDRGVIRRSDARP